MKINDQVENKKRQFASWLTSSSESYSLSTKKHVLIIIGLACSIVCLSLILNPLINRDKRTKAAKPTTTISGFEEPLLTDEDEKALQGFMYTLDSIKKIDSVTYDKAMQGREGLLDSIRFLLQYTGKSLTN